MTAKGQNLEIGTLLPAFTLPADGADSRRSVLISFIQ